jgi:hypothetical protein
MDGRDMGGREDMEGGGGSKKKSRGKKDPT